MSRERLGLRGLGSIAAVALLGLLGAGCAEAGAGPVAVGRPVPEWQGERLSGGEWQLQQTGRPRLVNLWATWCPPCRAEMPFLQSLHERYAPQGLEVVGITSDAASARAAVGQFVGDIGVGFEVVLDPAGATLDLFGVFGLPATFLVDSEGSIQLIRRGPIGPEDTELVQTIERLVSAP